MLRLGNQPGQYIVTVEHREHTVHGGPDRLDDALWGYGWTAAPGQDLAQALTAVDAEHVLAATQDGVYESPDGGRTFTKRLEVAAGDGH
ncbi:hypothetical protein ACWCXB_35890 [Streptomyces sp. NPDC001514]